MGNSKGKETAERRHRKDRRRDDRRIDDQRMAGIGEIRADRRKGPRRLIKRRARLEDVPLVRGADESAGAFATRVKEEEDRRRKRDRRDDSRRIDDQRLAGIGEIMMDRRHGLRRLDERRGPLEGSSRKGRT